MTTFTRKKKLSSIVLNTWDITMYGGGKTKENSGGDTEYMKSLSATPSSHYKSNDFEHLLWQLLLEKKLVINSTEHMRYNNVWGVEKSRKIQGGDKGYISKI